MQISRITVAATDMDAMVAFYNTVFSADMKPFEAFGGNTLFRGRLGGIELVLCPNEVAGVDAHQNRQQFQFTVEDIDRLLSAVKTVAGATAGAVVKTDTMKFAEARDPDGNTIEFIEPV